MPKPCGTHAAYVRHLKKGEPACQPCLNANAADTRARYAATRASSTYKARDKARDKASGGATARSATPRRRYEIEPLLRVCNGERVVLAERAGVSLRTIVRWVKAGGVPERFAARAATRNGLHPGDLWSEWWDYPAQS